MHPELLSSLATERRRDLAAAITARPVSAGAWSPAGRAWRRPRLALPRFRVSWTRTTLAAVAGSRRRGSSFVIVISATRACGPALAPTAAAAPSDRGTLVKAL